MHHIIATATLCVLTVLPSLACTSFIVSGKATKSRRPMIFKNRDTGNLDNCMVTVKGERYRFMGVAAKILPVRGVGEPSALNSKSLFCLVTKKPGAMALTRIFCPAKCTASHCVKLETAALAPE